MAFINFIADNLKLVWNRLTLSKITIAYVIFTLVHCILQVSLQADAFTLNSSADSFLKQIVVSAGLATPTGINVLVKNGPLYLCQTTPGNDYQGCEMIWSPRANVAGSTVSGTATWSDGAYAAVQTATTSSVTTDSAYLGTPTPTPTSSLAVATSTDVITVTVSKHADVEKGDKNDDKGDNDDNAKHNRPGTTTTAVITSTSSTSPSPTQTSSIAVSNVLNNLDSTRIVVDTDRQGDAIDINLKTRDGVTTSEDFVTPDWKRNANGDTTSYAVVTPSWKRSLQVGKATFDRNGTLVSVPISGFPSSAISGVPSTSAGSVNISPICVDVLAWPLQGLATSGREDIVFLVFNIWVLGMSFVAVLNESMPHMIAVVVTHVLLTSWTAFQIFATSSFRSEFLRITKEGACHGINLLPTYWTQRQNVEIAELVLNVVALGVSLFLSWKLVKQFGWQTFKRVGASLSVNAMYKLVLGLSVVLQLSMFFIVTSMVLWIEQISDGPARSLTTHVEVYESLYLVVIILLVPWAASGWFGVRREHKAITLVFLIGAVMVLTSWGGMFFSHVFRLLFATWGFFAMLTIIAMGLSGITLVLGIACRLKFGKNSKVLASYLKTDEEAALEKQSYGLEEAEFEYGEKFEFPASDVPSYEAVMNRGAALATVVALPLDAHTRSPSTSRSGSPFSSRSSSPIPNDAPAYDPSGRSSIYTISSVPASHQPGHHHSRPISTASSSSTRSYITRITSNSRGSSSHQTQETSPISKTSGPSRYRGLY